MNECDDVKGVYFYPPKFESCPGASSKYHKAPDMSIRTAIAMHCMAGYNANPDIRPSAEVRDVARWAKDDANALIAELTKDGGQL